MNKYSENFGSKTRILYDATRNKYLPKMNLQ